MTPTPTFGVLLVNLGSPDAPTTGAVRAYLREFLADRRVVDLPRLRWWLIRQLFILPTRPRRSARLYRKIWTDEGSPLAVITNRIGNRLEIELGATAEVPVVVGMRYGRPSIGAGLERLFASGCRRVVVLPLFPQYSHTTTASVIDAVGRVTSGWIDAPTIRPVTEYHDHPAYLDALVATIREAWAGSGTQRRLLMSFHGLPQRYADAGDPYPIQCARTAKALADRLELAPGEWHMAYQSRFGRERWLRPALDDRLDRWGRLGVRGVDVICPGFAADCLETLEEVAMAGRRRFESAGGSEFRYLPALNDHPTHITALSQIVIATAADWLAQKTRSR